MLVLLNKGDSTEKADNQIVFRYGLVKNSANM